MKKIITAILFSLPLFASAQLTSLILHGDTIFNKNPSTGDSIQMNKLPRVWGTFVGTLSNQTDLQSILDNKQATLVSATNIKTVNGSSLLGSGDLVVSGSDATKLAILNNLSDLNNAATARINLGVSTTANIAASTNKNYVTDAQATVIGNTSGTNSGDNAANTTYANDYRAANFVAGTNYLAPNGSAASLTNNTGGWTTLRVSGSNATTTGQSLVDITGLNSVALSNATLYEVEAVLYVTTSAVTTGTQYAITAGGTGGASEVFMNVSGTTTTNAATTVTQAASGTQIGTFLTTSGSSGIVTFKGYVLTRGSGTATISVQHLKVTSGTSTVKIGSVLRYRLAS